MASVMYCVVWVLLLASQLYSMEGMVTHGKLSSLPSELKHEVHIIYMGAVRETAMKNLTNVHMEMLYEALGSVQGAADSIVYSYKTSFNGFAAVLTEGHAEKIRRMEGVVSVFKSQTKHLHTTKSWEFLGLSSTEGLWPQSNFGSGTIVGLIDTGVWPEAHSFNDDGFGPIPSKWKGSCVTAEKFSPKNCNKKLIGAKFFAKGYEAQSGPIEAPEFRSPRDANGHGTHTSTTAAGRQVANASLLGVANGTASGGAPFARVAIYKVCWYESCNDADILAAYDEAVSDGVDLLSLSLGGFPEDYKSDVIAIGAFHAVERGIIVSCSAGNSGPAEGSVTNDAPWIFTVGASTINRVFQSRVELHGGPSVAGIALNPYKLNSSHPFVYSGDIPAVNATTMSAASCYFGCIDAAKAEGKIVVCKEGEASPEVTIMEAGGVGLVLITDEDETVQFVPFMPRTNVDSKTGDVILQFINTTKIHTGTISPSVSVFNTIPAPVMAYFSSVGPSALIEDLMKPDITAPGVDILAAWAPVVLGGEDGHVISRGPEYNIISGTSMSCPHVTGAAALVKSVHPDWSPAAVKSAIMTTATPLNTSISGNSELASGAGQINPTRAVDPGLVFNTTVTNYVNFLCTIGYNSTEVQLVSGRNETCPKFPPAVVDLNYPSIFVTRNLKVGLPHRITRTVTNVGPASGPVRYSATVQAPLNVVVEIAPSYLLFSDINEEQSFHVTVTILESLSSSYNFGSITWEDERNDHSVRMVLGVGSVY